MGLGTDLLQREHLVQSHQDEKARSLVCLGVESKDVGDQSQLMEDCVFFQHILDVPIGDREQHHDKMASATLSAIE